MQNWNDKGFLALATLLLLSGSWLKALGFLVANGNAIQSLDN